MKIHQLPSPNFNDRPNGEQDITALVLHYTGMKDAEEVKERLCCPEAGVSAHYFIEEDGTIIQHVAEEKRAWHAGVSSWRGRENVNDYSIGIEIQNPGHEWGYRPFPDAQMQSVIALSKKIIARYAIEKRNVIAHSDIAPTRKQDPGELFDWSWLELMDTSAGARVSLERRASDTPIAEAGAEAEAIKRLQESLSHYGYGLDLTGSFDEQTSLTITAFQRHFRQDKVNGQWDNECDALLAELLKIS